MLLKNIFISLLLITSIFAALPPDVQRRIDLDNMNSYLKMQDKSTIVIKAKVTSVKEIVPNIDPKSRMSYYEKIVLKIQKSEVLRNKNNIEIPSNMIISYDVFVGNMMPGPKVDNVLIPDKNRIYTFYLSDGLSLNASNYSIDTEDNQLREYALGEVNFKLVEMETMDFEDFKIYDMPPKNKIFRFNKTLDSKTKDKIKSFLQEAQYKKYNFINIRAYSAQTLSEEDRFDNTYMQVQQINRFLEKELKIDPNKITFSMNYEAKKVCTEENKSQFKQPCNEINLWIDLVLK